MGCEYRLQAGQRMTLALPAGAEIFCASGALRVTAMPRGLGGETGTFIQGLATGQGWRADGRATVVIEGRQAARCLVEVPAVQPARQQTPAANENSLLLWGRRLFGAV